jgi:hypothetical protein
LQQQYLRNEDRMTARLPHSVLPGISRWLAAGALLSLLAATPAALAEERFYKYDNAEGLPVIDDRVPPELAHKGYTVLNRAGRVVEVVPRTLTEEERKANPGAVQAMLRAEEAERQRRYDEALLARYSSVADIEDLQRRKVNEVQVRINLQKGTVAGLKQQLESEHAKAAELELAEAPVPAEVQKKIEELRASIAEEEARIARLEQDRNTTQARYQFDIERFRAIRPDSR